MKNTDTFAEFWRRYLRDHAQPGTRTLHFVGNGVAVAALILAVVMLDPMIAIIGALLGYVFAWSGHRSLRCCADWLWQLEMVDANPSGHQLM